MPRYRSETIFGLPFTRAISRRYQYVFPPIFFGYKLATTLGHTPSSNLNSNTEPRVTCADLTGRLQSRTHKTPNLGNSG